MSLRTKLLACFSLVLLAAGSLAAYSLYSVRTFRRQLREEIETGSLRLDQARQITIGLANMRSATRGLTLFAATNNTSGVAKARTAFETSAKEMRGILENIGAVRMTAADAAAVDAIRSALDQWLHNFPEFVALIESGNFDEANRVTLQKTSPVMDAIQKNASEFGNANRARHDAAVSAVESRIDKAMMVTLVMIVLLLLAGVGAFLVVASLIRGLKEIAASVAAGAEQVATASAEVSSASRSLAQGASEQAGSLVETSASSEEINSMARRNAENSQKAAELVTHSGDRFKETNRSLDSMLVAMGEISASSEKISKIIKVIDEIAFQTNILALNAAVEAARAGEAGMGFAVVADEVRNLAQRCAQAARDTTSLIEESIVSSTAGKLKVDRVAENTRAITEEAAKVKVLVDEVHLGSSEQAHGIEQIGIAIARMEQLTQTTASSAEQSAAAATEMNAQSETLRDVAKRLAVMVYGAEA